MNITVYGKDGCAPCKALKTTLEEKQIEFSYKNIMECMDDIIKYNIKSVPTTIITSETGEEIKRVVGNKIEEILQ